MKAKYRCGHEIMLSFLETLENEGPCRITKMMYDAGASWPQTRAYVADMINRGLIEVIKKDDEQTPTQYRVTLFGEKWAATCRALIAPWGKKEPFILEARKD